MDTKLLDLDTSKAQIVDLTSAVDEFCSSLGDGLCNVFVPHATAGVAIFELGAGSDSDLLGVIDELLPADDRWRHRHGHHGHGRDHVLPAFIAPSINVPVFAGRLALGTWQSIALVDTNSDNPRRQVRLSFPGGVGGPFLPDTYYTRRLLFVGMAFTAESEMSSLYLRASEPFTFRPHLRAGRRYLVASTMNVLPVVRARITTLLKPACLSRKTRSTSSYM